VITAQQKYDRSEKGLERHRRYYEKNKHKGSAKSKAIYHYPGTKICSIKECKLKAERHHPDYNEPLKIILLCRKHHLKVHERQRKKCSICEKPQHARSFCNNHYAIWLRNRGK